MHLAVTEFSMDAVLFQADCKKWLMPMEELDLEKWQQHNLAKQPKTSTVSTVNLEFGIGVFKMFPVNISGAPS